jgi:aconitate hydratase
MPCDVAFLTVQGLAEGSSVTLEGKKEDGSTYSIPLAHTFNDNQIKWFKAGSALNAVRCSTHVARWLGVAMCA